MSPRSSRRASARTRGPKRTTTAISTTPDEGVHATIRRIRGSWLAASSGPRRRIWPLARSVVQGVSWRGGLDPARVSARICANWLGQAGLVEPSPPARRPSSARAGTARLPVSARCPGSATRPPLALGITCARHRLRRRYQRSPGAPCHQLRRGDPSRLADWPVWPNWRGSPRPADPARSGARRSRGLPGMTAWRFVVVRGCRVGHRAQPGEGRIWEGGRGLRTR